MRHVRMTLPVYIAPYPRDFFDTVKAAFDQEGKTLLSISQRAHLNPLFFEATDSILMLENGKPTWHTPSLLDVSHPAYTHLHALVWATNTQTHHLHSFFENKPTQDRKRLFHLPGGALFVSETIPFLHNVATQSAFEDGGALVEDLSFLAPMIDVLQEAYTDDETFFRIDPKVIYA